jgi:hypothetical protein
MAACGSIVLKKNKALGAKTVSLKHHPLGAVAAFAVSLLLLFFA